MTGNNQTTKRRIMMINEDELGEFVITAERSKSSFEAS